MKITTLKRRSTAALLASCLGVIALIGVACGSDDPAGGPSRAEFDRLSDQVGTLEDVVERLAGLIGMLPGTMTPPTTMMPEPMEPDDDVTFVHGTFDTSDVIEENIVGGTTLFRIDQQQPLQGYGAIMTLALQLRYGITPASPITRTDSGLITADEQRSGSTPSRFPFGNAGSYAELDDIREMAGELDLIAIQHAECAYDSFWCVVQEGIEQAESDTNVNVQISAPEAGQAGSAPPLTELVRNAVAANPDGILLTFTYPNDAGFRAAVQSAIDANIPVVTYNAGQGPTLDEIDSLTHYGQNELDAGRQAATRLIAAAREADLTPVGVCVNHAVGNASTDARCRGFAEVFNMTDGATLASGTNDGVLTTSDDAAASVQVITDFQSNNSDVTIYLTMGPNSAGPFYTFADDELEEGEFVHGTFDTNDIINTNIRSGRTEFGIDQQPFLQGYGAVTTLYLNWLFNALPPTDVTATGPGFVTTANIDDIPANAQGYETARNNDVNLLVFDHGGPVNAWWETMRRTVQLAADNFDVTVTDRTSVVGDNADSALTAIQELAADAANVDGFVITLLSNGPTIGDAWVTAVNRLLEDDPVVVYNAGTGPEGDGINYATFLGQGEYGAGFDAGRALAAEARRVGLSNPLAACINQGVGSTNLDDRCRGFTDALEEANIPLVGENGVVSITNDVPSATSTLSDFYASNPNVNVWLTLGPDPARAFYNFIDDEGLN